MAKRAHTMRGALSDRVLHWCVYNGIASSSDFARHTCYNRRTQYSTARSPTENNNAPPTPPRTKPTNALNQRTQKNKLPLPEQRITAGRKHNTAAGTFPLTCTVFLVCLFATRGLPKSDEKEKKQEHIKCIRFGPSIGCY